jgi:hypothetical protein
MSKSVKKIIGVVVAVAIPFAAPAIASSIGLSAAVGKIAGSAIVGAAMGAGGAAISGGDVGRGALFGGIGGGLGGYSAGLKTAATAPGVATGAAPAGATGATAAGGGAAAGAGGLQEVVVTGLRTGQTAAGAAAPVVASAAGGAAAADAGGAAAPKKTFTQALREVPSAIADKFRDPAALADLTLRAAGMLAGSAAAGEGLSPDEQRLLQAQQEELNWLQKNNRAVFNQKLQEAQALLGEARYFDPEYFGLQAARRQQLAGAAQEREGLRGLTGERRRAAQRKIRLGVARNVGQAYDVGFGTGVSGRLQTRQAGLTAMPEAPATYGGYTGLAESFRQARTGRQGNLEGIGDLFGSLTGRRRAGLTGMEEDEDQQRGGGFG